jgi:hypothetical protein
LYTPFDNIRITFGALAPWTILAVFYYYTSKFCIEQPNKWIFFLVYFSVIISCVSFFLTNVHIYHGEYPNIYWFLCVIPILTLIIALIIVCDSYLPKSYPSHTYQIFLPATFLYSAGLIQHLDYVLSFDQPQFSKPQVMDKIGRSGLGQQITLSAWSKHPSEQNFTVNRWTFNRLKVGKPACITTKQGIVGGEMYKIEPCSD